MRQLDQGASRDHHFDKTWSFFLSLKCSSLFRAKTHCLPNCKTASWSSHYSFSTTICGPNNRHVSSTPTHLFTVTQTEIPLKCLFNPSIYWTSWLGWARESQFFPILVLALAQSILATSSFMNWQSSFISWLL